MKMQLERIRIGFWCAPDHHDPAQDPDHHDPAQDIVRDLVLLFADVLNLPHYPDPRQFVDTTWDPRDRNSVVDYLQRGVVVASYFGVARCRMCSMDDLGCKDLGDADYLWPEGYYHYVRDHAVKPPQAFIDHVFQRMRRR